MKSQTSKRCENGGQSRSDRPPPEGLFTDCHCGCLARRPVNRTRRVDCVRHHASHRPGQAFAHLVARQGRCGNRAGLVCLLVPCCPLFSPWPYVQPAQESAIGVPSKECEGNSACCGLLSATMCAASQHFVDVADGKTLFVRNRLQARAHGSPSTSLACCTRLQGNHMSERAFTLDNFLML
jgi:hypothetical protein